MHTDQIYIARDGKSGMHVLVRILAVDDIGADYPPIDPDNFNKLMMARDVKSLVLAARDLGSMYMSVDSRPGRTFIPSHLQQDIECGFNLVPPDLESLLSECYFDPYALPIETDDMGYRAIGRTGKKSTRELIDELDFTKAGDLSYLDSRFRAIVEPLHDWIFARNLLSIIMRIGGLMGFGNQVSGQVSKTGNSISSWFGKANGAGDNASGGNGAGGENKGDENSGSQLQAPTVSITGMDVVGERVTAKASNLPEGATQVSYQWQYSSTKTGTFSDIGYGGNKNSYEISEEDEDYYLRCKVTTSSSKGKVPDAYSETIGKVYVFDWSNYPTGSYRPRFNGNSLACCASPYNSSSQIHSGCSRTAVACRCGDLGRHRIPRLPSDSHRRRTEICRRGFPGHGNIHHG